MLWMIDTPGDALRFGFDSSEGPWFGGQGRLARAPAEPDFGSVDEDRFAVAAADLAFTWRVWRAGPAVEASVWPEPEAHDALVRLRARTPGATLARSTYVRAYPPHLPRPVVETQILAADDAAWSGFRAPCDAAFGMPGARVWLHVAVLGFYAPGSVPPGLDVPTADSETFLRGGAFVYGRLRGLGVEARR